MMAMGATLSVGAYVLAVIMGFVFFLNYHYVIEHEEKKLPSYFGQSYLDYCKVVPRFLPRFTPAPRDQLLQINNDPEIYSFNFPLAIKNKAFEAFYSFVGIMVGMVLLVWVKQLVIHGMN